MQLMDIEGIKNKIIPKLENGDYITLSKILLVKRNTAASRFIRNNKTAVLIMKEIVKEREKTISKLKAKYSTSKVKLYTR